MRIIFCILVLFSLSACSYLPHWWGEQEEETDAATKAKRVSALKEGSLLAADPRLKNTGISLPKAYRNPSWSQANDQQQEENQHLDLPKQLSKTVKIHIGKGAVKGFHLTASPVVADKMLYAVDSKGYVSAYSTDNLEKRLWQSKTLFRSEKDKGFVGGGIAYANGQLFLTTGFDDVVALNAKDGTETWRHTLDSIARAAPIVADGKVFVMSVDNKTYALNQKNGNIIWTHSGAADTLGTLGAPPPAYVKGAVLVPYASGEIYALQAKSGLEAWYDNVAGNLGDGGFSPPDIDASPVVAYGKVFASSTGGYLVANELASGRRLWQQDISLAKTPWIAGNMLFAVTSDAELAAISVKDGAVKWVVPLSHFDSAASDDEKKVSWSGPVLAGGLLRLAGSHGKLLSILPADGTLVDTNDIPEGVYITPVVADSALYVLGSDAVLMQLR